MKSHVKMHWLIIYDVLMTSFDINSDIYRIDCCCIIFGTIKI